MKFLLLDILLIILFFHLIKKTGKKEKAMDKFHKEIQSSLEGIHYQVSSGNGTVFKNIFESKRVDRHRRKTD